MTSFSTRTLEAARARADAWHSRVLPKHFRKEALALSMLNHTSIAIVHEFDTQQGIDFLVTEYVPRGDPERENRGSGPAGERVHAAGLQLVEGSAATHRQRVIHAI